MKSYKKKKKTAHLSIIIFLFFACVSFFATKYIQESSAQNSNSDIVKPIITIIGGDQINIGIGTQYTEQGATATDNIDGDITSKITTSDNIDTSKLGEYYINYKVTDKSNNESVAQRKVNVVNPNTDGVPILMYHFFYDANQKGRSDDGNMVDIGDFEQQMKYLKDNNYYFPTWDEMERYIDDGNILPEKSVIITVDDGATSFFDMAYPILVKYHIPATSFLITNLTNPATLNIDRNLISFQSHSHTMHNGGCTGGHGGKFLCIDHQAGIDDLNTSKQIVGSSEVFCYPFGDYNDNAKQLLRETGYKMAVTTEYGKAKIGMDKLVLPRIRVNGTNSLNSFIDSIE